MKKMYSVLKVFFIFLVVLSFSTIGLTEQVQASDSKTLKIGAIIALTGMMAAGHKPVSDSLKPTETLLNQHGGITVNGQHYDIEIVVEDSQSSPPGAVAAINKMIQHGIKFTLAPIFMPNNLAIAPIAEEAKVLRVVFSTVGLELFGPNLRYIFCTDLCVYNIGAVYDYMKKTYPQVKKIAHIMPDDPGGMRFRDYDIKIAKKNGMETVFNEAFPIGTEDFYPILTKALAKKPDAIDIEFCIVPWSKGIITQARELGFKRVFYYPSFLGDINQLRSMLAPEYAYDIFHAGADVLSPKMLPIVKDLGKLVEKELPTKFNMDHVMLLQGIWPLLQAIEKAQSFDTDKVVDTWAKMKSVESIFGKGTMGGMDTVGINRILIRPVTISRIVNKDKEVEFGFYEPIY